jgi:hypothetical protein
VHGNLPATLTLHKTRRCPSTSRSAATPCGPTCC